MILTFRAGAREWSVQVDNKHYLDFNHEDNEGKLIELSRYD